MTQRQKKTRSIADQEELKLRTAWHYFIEGITQEQVAARLGISRVKAYRLLSATREDGTVQITINSQLEPLMRVQRALEKHLGLFEAVVVPVSKANDAAQSAVVGHATGLYLSKRLEPGQSIGLGWGATLQIAATAARHGLALLTRNGSDFTGLESALVVVDLSDQPSGSRGHDPRQ